MKKRINYFTIAFIFLFTVQSFAQYGNNGRRGGMSTNMYPDNKSKKEPVNQVEVMTENMTTKLNLDGFQSAIVKNIIAEYLKTVDGVFIEDIPDEAKTEKSKIAQNVMEAKFAEILNDKQKVLLEDLKNKVHQKRKTKIKRMRRIRKRLFLNRRLISTYL